MFNYRSIKTERVFEENIDALATDNNFVQALFSPVRIKEREDSTSVIDSITSLQGFLQTLAKPQETLNALNVINPIGDPTGHDIRLKLNFKTQYHLVDVLVQTVSGVVQCMVALDEKYNNDSKYFKYLWKV